MASEKKHVLVVLAMLAVMASAFNVNDYDFGAAIRCQSPDTGSATCICNQTRYDFSQIAVPSTGSHLFSSPEGKYLYYFQMTGGGLPNNVGKCRSLTSGSAFAQQANSGSGVECFSLGNDNQQTWALYPGNATFAQQIFILFTGGDSDRQTTLEVTCSRTVRANFTAVGETYPGSGIYVMKMESCAACPGNNPCHELPPIPPPAPPPQTPCLATSYVNGAVWPNARGGIQGLGQTSVLPTSCTLWSRLQTVDLDGNVVVGDGGGVFAATSWGMYVSRNSRPVAQVDLPQRLSNLVVSDHQDIAFVTANATTNFTVYSLTADPISVKISDSLSTAAQVLSYGDISFVSTTELVSTKSSISRIYQGVMEQHYKYDEGYTGTVMCLAMNEGASIVYSTIQMKDSTFMIVAHDAMTLLPLFTYKSNTLWYSQCPMVTQYGILVLSTSATLMANLTTGEVLWQTDDFACLGNPGTAVVTPGCVLFCVTQYAYAAFDLVSHLPMWTIPIDSNVQVYQTIVDSNSNILTLAVSNAQVTLSSILLGPGVIGWSSSFTGIPNLPYMAPSGNGEITLVKDASQIYTIGLGGVSCPVSQTKFPSH